MTQIVLNIEDASLVPSLKQILGAIKGVTIGKLVTKDTAIDAEKKLIADTTILGYQQAKEGKFAGENLSNIDDLVSELRAEAE